MLLFARKSRLETETEFVAHDNTHIWILNRAFHKVTLPYTRPALIYPYPFSRLRSKTRVYAVIPHTKTRHRRDPSIAKRVRRNRRAHRCFFKYVFKYTSAASRTRPLIHEVSSGGGRRIDVIPPCTVLDREAVWLNYFRRPVTSESRGRIAKQLKPFREALRSERKIPSNRTGQPDSARVYRRFKSQNPVVFREIPTHNYCFSPISSATRLSCLIVFLIAVFKKRIIPQTKIPDSTRAISFRHGYTVSRFIYEAHVKPKTSETGQKLNPV